MMKKIAILFLTAIIIASAALPALAAEFTPSVEAKPAPEIVAQIGAGGKEYAAIIRDAEGKEVDCVPMGELTVTPVSQTDKASAEIEGSLKDAYQQMKSVKDLTELSDQLENVVKEFKADISVENLVVRDLFDVSVSKTFAEKIKKEGNKLSVRFTLSADAETLAAVLHNVEGKTWETIPNDCIIRNKDCTADVLFDSLSPVAFLFDAGKPAADASASGSNTTVWIIAGAAIAACAVVFMAVKKHAAPKE